MSLDDLYRRVIMDHYQHPRNKGIKSDEGIQVHLHNPSCGDRITLQLLMEGDQVKEARFEGEGCSISMSSASMMTEAVKGLTKEEALRKVEQFSCMMMGEGEVEDLGDLEALQGVSKFPARIKCATLAWKALEKGLQEKEE
ncbi:iron-sulfur cluster assembly scaffold protein [[Clostridium] ultunense Esp]|nr:iron-sulfur cluster assembly scaffold protein [[Clostridium] ultunense Esp]